MPASLTFSRGLAALIKSGFGVAANTARSALLRVDHWFLAYRTQQDKFVANRLEISGEGLKVFSLDPTRFHADPCVFEHEGVDHVFFEEFSYKKRKGVISWSRLQTDGTLSPPSVVLEEPTRLSYPFVFSYQGAVYMIPETSRQREIALYEALEFPRRWRKATVLFENIAASDATLHVHDDHWWMFVNIRQDGFSGSDELFLFYARTPFWSVDGAPAEPDQVGCAIRPIRRPAVLSWRPSDPAGPGPLRFLRGALLLCEVQELTTANYRESVINRLDPAWLAGNSGFHTLSFSNQLEIIDGRLDLPRWRARTRASG